MPDAALAEAVRHIREIALREAMAMCNRMQCGPGEDSAAHDDGDEAAFRRGHRHARMQLYAEIERMIARETPMPAPQAGYFTNDGLEDG